MQFLALYHPVLYCFQAGWMPVPRLVSTNAICPFQQLPAHTTPSVNGSSTATCTYSICCLCVAPSQLCLISARKLLTSTLTILQGKQDAERPTAETILSDKLLEVQNEKKLLLQEINEILRAWREDATRREEAATRREEVATWREEVLIAIVCLTNACCS